MSTFPVYLSSVQDVKLLFSAATQFPFEIDVITERHTLSAKSIMALFSLDLSKPVRLNVNASEKESAAFQAEITSLLAQVRQTV